MEYGYGIQKLSEEIANKKAYDQEKLSIHFQNLESVNPEDYNTPGKSALKTLQVFCQNGALIALDYSTIDKTGLYIGKIEAGTKIELEKIKDKWFKTIQVIDLRKRTYFPDDYRFFGSARDKYQQVGNSVPPLMSYAIAKSIRNKLKK